MKRQKYDVVSNSAVTVDLTDNEDLTLLLVTAGSGGYTVTFPGVDKWISATGGAPAQPVTVGAAAEWAFFQTGGVTYGRKATETGPNGAAGATGPTGVHWKRLWTNATTYAINDAVYWNGSSYIALQPSSSTDVQQPNLAPTYWGPLASGSTAGSTAEYVDTFVRANSANISTGAPFAYTALAGTGTEILSNMCHCSDTANVVQHVRAEQVLSSTDHHAQVTLGLWTPSGNVHVDAGVFARYDVTADTGYVAHVQQSGTSTWQLFLSKVVAGVRTALVPNTTVGQPVAGDTLKITVTGTSLGLYYNGVLKISLTDSSITTGVRSGFYLNRATSAVNVSLAELRFGI